MRFFVFVELKIAFSYKSVKQKLYFSLYSQLYGQVIVIISIVVVDQNKQSLKRTLFNGAFSYIFLKEGKKCFI